MQSSRSRSHLGFVANEELHERLAHRRRGDNAPMSLMEFVELGAGAAGTPVSTEEKAPKKGAKASGDAPKAEKGAKAEGEKAPAKRAKKTAAKAEKEEG